ncbi:ATP-dependent helicase [Chryseomicrobium palamuruense]|uniref:DNA 3'-5' helicase n=1 Tax=Chryseomicrobium palamuruense TaxID=682973 RepID=A0ABV8UWC2_9BACL
MEKYFENLNPPQIDAVSSTEGYIRVLAGAGSGKTKVLTNRYAYLVEGLGISTQNILCVTFTNKAANEMRKRIKRLLHEQSEGIYISTFHGFGVKILKEDIHHINYPKNFSIIDTEDQKTILREIYEELNLTIKFMKFKELLRKISLFKLNPKYISWLVDPTKGITFDDSMTTLDIVIRKYLYKQRKYFALDFQDILNFVMYLFDNHLDTLKKWQSRLHYIQVDEFQDCSDQQYAFVSRLAQKNNNLFVVGDPDQTIYTWRGAKPQYLINFDKNHQNVKTIILNQNYRSTPEILDLSNKIIKNNKLRIDKDLFTENPNGIQTVHFHGKNEFEETKYVISTINSYITTKSANFKDFCILYRANNVSRFIEQGLLQEDVPYVVLSGVSFFERREIKDALAYLKMVIYSDDLSFLRTVNMPKRKFGKVKLKKLKEIADGNDNTLYNTLLISDRNAFSGTDIESYIAVIEKFKKEYSKMKVSEILRDILDQSGYDILLRTEGDQDRIDNIAELLFSIQNLEHEYGEPLTLEDYLEQVSLYTDTERQEKDAVKLMTIHSAKGLEFPYVFLVGFNDGLLPNFRALKDLNKLEEERRLTYVAVTRAEKEFHMTESEGYTFQGARKIPSRFIFEIKQNIFTRIGEIDKDLLEESIKTYTNNSPQPETIMVKNSESNLYEINSFVKHPIFGKGEIKEIDDSSGTYKIYFESIDSIREINQNFKGLKIYSN